LAVVITIEFRERERGKCMGRRGQGHTCMCVSCGYVRRVKDAGPVAEQIRFRSPSHVLLGRALFEDRVLRLLKV
jgi:hypothetical protein